MGISAVFNFEVVGQNFFPVQDIKILICDRVLRVDISQLPQFVGAQIMLRKYLVLKLSDRAPSEANGIDYFSPGTVVVGHAVGRVAQNKSVILKATHSSLLNI